MQCNAVILLSLTIKDIMQLSTCVCLFMCLCVCAWENSKKLSLDSDECINAHIMINQKSIDFERHYPDE